MRRRIVVWIHRLIAGVTVTAWLGLACSAAGQETRGGDLWRFRAAQESDLAVWGAPVGRNADRAVVQLVLAPGETEQVLRLTLPEGVRGIAAIEHSVPLPSPAPELLRVKAIFRAVGIQSSSGALMVAVFRGGTAAGNDRWRTTKRLTWTTDWHEEQLLLTVPPDAKELVLMVRLDRAAGSMDVREVTVRSVRVDEIYSTVVAVGLNPAQERVRITPLHMALQMVHFLPGFYDGTLPESDPRSKRKAFLGALEQAGIRAIRFPGGTNSHWYLAESTELTAEISGLVRGRNWPRNHYPKWHDVRDTFRSAGIQIVYQLNTSYYMGETGQLRPVGDSKYPKQFGHSDGREHPEEAARALDRAFETGVFAPGDVDYWEMGNEEFAKMTAEQYAAIVAAFAKVLVRRDPGRPICYTGFARVDELLTEHGVLKHMTAVTTHYPYSAWPRPQPLEATADYVAFAHGNVHAQTNHDGFAARQKSGEISAHLKRSVSETSVYRYGAYDSFRMGCSFAHAMAFARNWPGIVDHPAVDMAVLHDFESPYFGLIMYHQRFSRSKRAFDWLPPHVKPTTRVAETRRKDEKNWFVSPNAGAHIDFPREYVPTPTARSTAMISRFAGATTIAVTQRSGSPLPGMMAGSAPGRQLFFVANPADEPVCLRLEWPAAWPLPQGGTRTTLDADSFFPVLESEYRLRTGAVPRPENGGVETMLLPRSIQLFEWR